MCHFAALFRAFAFSCALAVLLVVRSAQAQSFDAAMPADASLDAPRDVAVEASSPAEIQAIVPAVVRAQCRIDSRDPDQVRFEQSLGRLVVPREVVIDCSEDLRECSGSFEVRLDYCGGGFIRLRRATLLGAGVTGQGSAQLIVSSGESRSTTMTFSGRGISAMDLLLEVTLSNGGTLYTRRSIRVRNPARERALAACRVCRGDWGRHGMLGVEGCLCRARDRGRRCTDGRDCEGLCIVTGTEPVRLPSPCPASERPCTRGVAGVRSVGRCSEFVQMFGCHTYIPEGERDRPVSTSASIHSMCAD